MIVCLCVRVCQRYLPSSIVHGFTLGVGVIIACSQLSSALGIHDVPMRGNSLLNLFETVSRVGSMDAWAAIVCGASWLSLFLLIYREPRMPWSVLVTAAGIALGSAHNLHYAPRDTQKVAGLDPLRLRPPRMV